VLTSQFPVASAQLDQRQQPEDHSLFHIVSPSYRREGLGERVAGIGHSAREGEAVPARPECLVDRVLVVCAAGNGQRTLRERDRTRFARVEHRAGQSRKSARDKRIVVHALSESERSASLADSGRRSFAEAERFCQRQLDLGLYAE
jgi:hypothetical protein